MEAPQERWTRALPGALASGALYAIAQPPFACWPIGFVCLVPLLFAMRRRGARARCALGFVAGATAGCATSLVPAGSGLAAYFAWPWLAGAAAAALVTGLAGGVAFAVFGWLAGDPARTRPWLLPWRCGAAFAVGEVLRSHLATGFPWLLLAHALAPAPRAAQLASTLGVFGLGALLAAANAALAALVRRDARRAAVASAFAIVAAMIAADRLAPAFEVGTPGSVAAFAPGAPARAGMLRVALVQPASPREESRDATKLRSRLDALVALSREALPVELLVWPENAVNAVLPANAALVREALAALRPPPSHLLFGAPRYDPAAPARVFNAAVLWSGEGAPLASHDKVRLLPFTEYVPAPFAALGARGGHATPGERLAPIDAGGTRIGVLICYELLFPALARSLTEGGAEILVNPSNDDWFGDTAGREQMLAAAVLRAIETRRPLLRATPSGATAAIDARGRVVARLRDHEPGVLRVDVAPVR